MWFENSVSLFSKWLVGIGSAITRQQFIIQKVIKIIYPANYFCNFLHNYRIKQHEQCIKIEERRKEKRCAPWVEMGSCR